MKARGRLARALALALFVLALATAGVASAQYREFTGKINRIGKSTLIVDNRMGDKLQFERVEETRITDERDVKKRKASWADLKKNDWVTVHWRMMDKPRKAYEVIVLPPRTEGGGDR
jgi:hypothetical protein